MFSLIYDIFRIQNKKWKAKI